jgi:hypothetical protein
MKKQKLNIEDCQGLIKLLDSPDEGDKIIALTALENSIYNLKQLLIIRLMTKIRKELWKSHAPKAISYMEKEGKGLTDEVTWDYVLKSIYEDELSNNTRVFAEQAFSDFILRTLKSLSPHLGNIATITIKLNPNGKTNN